MTTQQKITFLLKKLAYKSSEAVKVLIISVRVQKLGLGLLFNLHSA